LDASPDTSGAGTDRFVNFGFVGITKREVVEFEL
jgi:hypothetical protein